VRPISGRFWISINRFSVTAPSWSGRTVRPNLPVSLYDFLVKLVADLCEGQSVAIVQNDAQLTTVEAARMLGVSRQFLVNLLERDDIPYHMVGTHRRIYVRDLLAYKAKRDSKRRQVLDDLTRAEAEDGLYELEPRDDRTK
jgi:excisionase family DNA binding protein